MNNLPAVIPELKNEYHGTFHGREELKTVLLESGIDAALKGANRFDYSLSTTADSEREMTLELVPKEGIASIDSLALKLSMKNIPTLTPDPDIILINYKSPLQMKQYEIIISRAPIKTNGSTHQISSVDMAYPC